MQPGNLNFDLPGIVLPLFLSHRRCVIKVEGQRAGSDSFYLMLSFPYLKEQLG